MNSSVARIGVLLKLGLVKNYAAAATTREAAR
jgi:hypothetical protein